MEENKKKFLDTAEINRIQQEIERNLYSMPQSDGVANIGGGILRTTKPDAAQPLSATADYDYAAGVPTKGRGAQAASNVFYSETVKNESKRNAKKKFRRSVTFTLIICTIGTYGLGMGIGAGRLYMGDASVPGISGEKSGNYINTSVPGGDQAKLAGISQTGVISSGGAVTVDTMSDVIKLAAPSVVSISAVFKSPSGYSGLQFQEGGSGSGFIFSGDPQRVYIATNYHVVSGAVSVSVDIEGGGNIPASFVGSDPASDLAVISVKKADISKAGVKSVSIAMFGNSDQMQLGDPVLAIGNAMGEGKVVTSGIISANNKEINISGNTLTVIQTDAAINPGNSGGPLVNGYGEVIGINTAKLSSANVEGMGYSITSNKAKPILDVIMQRIPKPFLGIQGADMTQELADLYNLPGKGVLVEDVVPGSSAQRAGIQRTDVITNFNGEAVFNMQQLTAAVKKCKVGDRVNVKICRNVNDQIQPLDFTVQLTEYKTDNF